MWILGKYARYTDAHWRNLIERYQPTQCCGTTSLIQDRPSRRRSFPGLLQCACRKGVIDNRFGVDFADFTTPEYAKYDKITPKKWKPAATLDSASAATRWKDPRRSSPRIGSLWLCWSILSATTATCCSTSGLARWEHLRRSARPVACPGALAESEREGIFGTRPGRRAAAKTTDGGEIRFTRKGDSVYAFLLSRPAGTDVAIPSIRAASATTVSLLGEPGKLRWSQKGGNLAISTGQLREYAWGFKITPRRRPCLTDGPNAELCGRLVGLGVLFLPAVLISDSIGPIGSKTASASRESISC